MHELFDGLHQNPFFSGGLTLMLLGSAVALLRKVPGQIWKLLERRLLISVEIPDRDPAFRWVQSWLAEQTYARRSRGLSLTTIWVNPEPAAASADEWWGEDDGSTPGSRAEFVLSPAPGVHLMTYRGRILILRRTRRDLQSGSSSAIQETMTIQIVGGTRSFIEELLGEAYTASLPKSPGVSVLTAHHSSWQ